MLLRTLWALVAVVGLIFGPTVWSMESGPAASMPSCCCKAEGAGSGAHSCCGVNPRKSNGSVPVNRDRAWGHSVGLEAPVAVLVSVIHFDPPVLAYRLAALFAEPEHSPPVLARNCILLI